ncbi:hypothetical protein C1645_790831 [Glomus cerebriforme]|uniref:Uncharacterized protein n=1 Tax=Glomus cerebriforme TaxID=658196 RepID=A0A397S6X4_9GLOM|nr:hypothetical protein C1645_790831 [Glomus cerebriforme]
MADSKSSVKRKSDSSKDEPQQIHIIELEAQELAKHRLRHLKDSFEEYNSLYKDYLQRHYLIISLCGVVSLFGIVIVFLKAEGKESLLYSFKALQSSFASLISGGSIIAFGSSILFPDKKASSDDSKDEPKVDAIRLCIERDLGEILDKTTKKLREKKDNLERAKSWQSIWAILGSIVVLFLVGIDFFGFLPDVKYIDIGLDCFLSLTGVYFLSCACILNSVLSNPIEKLEKNHLILFFLVIPCAYFDGLIRDEISISKILKYTFRPREDDEHWIKEAYLSSDEKVEIMYLLRGLNPDLFHLRVKKFCKEIKEESISAEYSTEETPLIVSQPVDSTGQLEFIKSVNEIKSEANRKVLNKYFSLGEALAECLENPQNSQRVPNKDSDIEDIVKKFSYIESDVKEICKHYIKLKEVGRGLTLTEFFDKHSRKIKQNLFTEEINVAHNALKVYSIFKGIGKKRINQIKTVSASSIGKFTRNEIIKIIGKYKP